MRLSIVTAAALGLALVHTGDAGAQTPSSVTPSTSTPSTGATSSAGSPGSAPAGQATAAGVPLPRERPAGPATAAPSAPSAPPTVVLMEPAPQAPTSGRLPQPSAAIARAAVPVGSLNAKQVETLQRVSTYFNAIQTLSGDFVQVAPDGSRSQGKFFLAKPGKVRFYYAAPSRTDVIADGSSVAVRDRKLATQDIWPLSQTPLRFLLAENLDLLRDTNVTAVYNEADLVSVTLLEKSAIGGPSKLMLLFGGSDYQLRQWTVTDAQGGDTSVAVFNLDSKTAPDPKLFKIDYQTIRDN
jgi:outer membrane lipoprotein-sorting protein